MELNKKIIEDKPINIYNFYKKYINDNKITDINYLNEATCALLTSITLLLNTYMNSNQRTYNHLFKLLCLMAEKTDWNQKTLVDRLFSTSEKIDKGNIANKMYQMFLYEVYNLSNYSFVISNLLIIYNKLILQSYKEIKLENNQTLYPHLIDLDKDALNKLGF